MSNKADLFDVESWLYDEYGTVEEVLEELDWYFGNGETRYKDFIEDILDNYGPEYYDWDDADIVQIYNDFISIGEIKYYDWDGQSWLELSDDHIMWNIDADIEEWEYYAIADDFLNKFEEEYDVSDVTYGGQSGRHILCPNTWENVLRYDELVAGMKKCQQDFIDYINSNYGGSTEEPRVRYF